LYCEDGDFYIDPWRPVAKALITHAHSDHARSGSESYWCASPGASILTHRLGRDIHLNPMSYGEPLQFGPVRVSFHSAGHVLGSSQIRLEHQDTGEVWVVSGDYKRTPDPSCAPFEVVPCDVFITESTFALPIYRWDDPRRVAEELYQWWQANRAAGKTSVVGCYALGKAQRLLAELARFTDDTVYLHGALVSLVQLYRNAGIVMPPTQPVSETGRKSDLAGELILAPPSALATTWISRFKKPQTAFASGWMLVRGNRRRRNVDKGFVLSDHADWPELVQTIQETGARQVLVTHGHGDTLIRYLYGLGIEARPLSTAFHDSGEPEED
jgi:putative mRNA 3-end processing factor